MLAEKQSKRFEIIIKHPGTVFKFYFKQP